MQNHNGDTIKTSDRVLKKNIPLTLFERVTCERELETEQNCNILTPLLWLSASFSRFPGLLYRRPGAHSAGCWLSLPHLVSNWSSLQTDLNSCLHRVIWYSKAHFFLWVSQIAFIQPIHGQAYDSDIPRPDAPVIYTGAFPILTARSGRRSIYKTTPADRAGVCLKLKVLVYLFFQPS